MTGPAAPAALDAAYARARTGRPSTVLVGGAAGAGKSRLLRAFTARLDGARVLTGCCLEPDGPAYAPFVAALHAVVRELGAARVAALLDGRAAELARLLPQFGAVPEETVDLRGRLFSTVLTLLERLAETRPLVLAVEDAHRADRDSRDLLTFLARSLRGTRVLLVVTYRPPCPVAGRLDAATRLRLPGAAGEPYGLTAREAEVLRLVAAGRTDRQVAAELGISVKTAGAHVSHILAKLGVTNRVQAAAAAHRRRLLGEVPGQRE